MTNNKRVVYIATFNDCWLVLKFYEDLGSFSNCHFLSTCKLNENMLFEIVLVCIFLVSCRWMWIKEKKRSSLVISFQGLQHRLYIFIHTFYPIMYTFLEYNWQFYQTKLYTLKFPLLKVRINIIYIISPFELSHILNTQNQLPFA